MDENQDLLDILLSTASEELQVSNKKAPTEIDVFGSELNLSDSDISKADGRSVIHNGDTDSSDDEKNFEERKYNECGRQIKKLITPPEVTYSRSGDRPSNQTLSWKVKPTLTSSSSFKTTVLKQNIDVYIDPFFGIRIVNPLISSALLQDRMSGREAVSFARLNRYIQMNGKEKDWVIAGVIVNKSAVKTSQKGKQFSIWTLSDLKGDIKTVALFLFSSAHSQLWKTSIGTVVGVLNPNVLDRKDGCKDEASLSIDNSQKLMIFGQSKDFGTCKSVKKNGDKCTAIVNKSLCEFCVYHIKQEYQKCSLRSELQSNFTGRGLTALRNKVLGKNEVFYAGKSYSAIPTKKSRKLEQKDNTRLQVLSGKMNGIVVNSLNTVKTNNKPVTKKKQNAARLDVCLAQRKRDLELLKKLGDGVDNKNNFNAEHSSNVTLEESKNAAIDIIKKLKSNNLELPIKTKNSQYDLKNDVLVNVDDKKSFIGKASVPVSLDESKSTDVHMISLKSKCNNSSRIENDVGNVDNTFTTDEIFMNDDFTLNYDEDLQKYQNNSGSNGDTTRKQGVLFCENTNLILNQSNSDFIDNLKFQSNLKHFCKSGKSPPTFSSQNCINNSNSTTYPVLSLGTGKNNMIDLSQSFTYKLANNAKQKAVRLIKKIGPIVKQDPNNTRGTGKKRPLLDRDSPESSCKKSKLAESEFISDRFKKMMAATSRHTDLIEARDDEAKDKYFSKLEAKERMEEKMATTYKIACKAVKCLKCKYKSFSSSDLCKSEKHPLVVFDAMKRFFKCGQCGNRTASLEIIPMRPCNNCGSGKWEKTGMMKEKIIGVAHTLSIRGGEQTFVNSVAADANINLLVPDND